jgi:beta-glucosidase
MKKFFIVLLSLIGILLGIIILTISIAFLWISVSGNKTAKQYLALAGPEVKIIAADSISFRDLNKNGILDIYEDPRRSTEDRIEDLISKMNLEEKAGMMFIPPISMKKDGSIAEKPSVNDVFSLMAPGTSKMLFGKYINHFSNNPLASAFAGDFSIWPEPLGFAAIGDSLLTWQFADIARQEYLSVGIRVALHPMADLATEPRWGRISGTFGEDAELSAKLIYAYIKGFQGDSLNSQGVACMTKHFSGGGPQKEGIDPHFPVAKGQVYPGHNFNYHLIPFEAAFKAGTAESKIYSGFV